MLVKNAPADVLGLSGKHICVPVFLQINTMPVAPVDSLSIYIGLKAGRICLPVLGLILLIIYCTTLSKAVFDFSQTGAMTDHQEYHLASLELRRYLVEGKREMETGQGAALSSRW